MAGDYISSARLRERFEPQRHQRFGKHNDQTFRVELTIFTIGRRP